MRKISFIYAEPLACPTGIALGSILMRGWGIALLLLANYALAQNLGAAPQTNVAVQGQTGAQPEGAFVNWVGNVIAPVGAGGAVVGAIVSWLAGRGFGRWLFAGALLAMSPTSCRSRSPGAARHPEDFAGMANKKRMQA